MKAGYGDGHPGGQLAGPEPRRPRGEFPHVSYAVQDFTSLNGIQGLGRSGNVSKVQRGQQFPACGFRPENTLVLISHFANSLRTMLSRIPYLTAWANGVTRHGTCFR